MGSMGYIKPMKHKLTLLSISASLLAFSAMAQQVPPVPLGIQVIPSGMPQQQQVVVTTTTTNSGTAAPVQPVLAQPLVVSQPPVVAAPPVYATSVVAAPQVTDVQFTQSPAYKECAALANSNPIAAEQKANEWLKIDDGVGPHHCRAMAFYGQRRFGEAAQELTFTRSKIAPGNVALRSYVAKQTAKAWMDTGRPDAAITALGEQIADMSVVRGDNANVSQLTSELLLERAKMRVTYGQPAEAVKDLDQAVSLTPTNETVLMERATAFAQLNDLALARQDVASVLKLNPANSKAQELKRQLQ